MDNKEKERVVMDCRLKPEANCSLLISGTEPEVLELAEYHVTTKHGFKKEAGLKDQLRTFLKRESYSR
jgi:hypothetical protein